MEATGLQVSQFFSYLSLKLVAPSNGGSVLARSEGDLVDQVFDSLRLVQMS